MNLPLMATPNGSHTSIMHDFQHVLADRSILGLSNEVQVIFLLEGVASVK